MGYGSGVGIFLSGWNFGPSAIHRHRAVGHAAHIHVHVMIRAAGFMRCPFIIFVIMQAVGMDAIGLAGFVVEDDLDRIAFDAADDRAEDTQPGRLRFLLGE